MNILQPRQIKAIAFIALLICIVLPGYNVAALDAKQTLTISPAILEKTVTPDSTIEQSLFIVNTGESAQSIRAYARAFVPNESVPSEYLSTYDTGRWFKFSQPDFILSPGEQRTVKFTLTVPRNAEPGGHYATLFFEQLVPAMSLNQKKVSVAPRVGALAFLTVKGDIKEKLTRSGFDVPKVSESGPITLKLKLKNEGNVHILPSGSIRIFNSNGKQLDQLPLKSGIVLPHTEREFSVVWTKPGLIGEYTAKADVSYGTPTQKLATRDVTFWVLPWMGAVISLVGLVLFILFAIKTHSHWRRAWEALTSPERWTKRRRGQ